MGAASDVLCRALAWPCHNVKPKGCLRQNKIRTPGRGPAMVRCILKRLQCVHDSEGILLVEYSGVPVLIYDCEVRIPVAVHFAKVRQSSDVQL